MSWRERAAVEEGVVKIADLEFYLVRLPRSGPHAPLESLLVRLATQSGWEGWGEAAIGWRAWELSARRHALLSSLAGRSVFDVEELLGLDCMALPALRSALEMASWDLIARAAHQPLCHLVGGYYRQRVPLAARLLPGPSEAVANAARELAEQGFHVQILAASGAREADLETLAAVKEAAGDRAEVRFDGAGLYQVETASELCHSLARDSVRYFLDPVAGGDLLRTAALARLTNVPLAVSAGLRSPADVLDAVRRQSASFAVIDTQQLGGMLAARRCTAVAEAAGMGVSLGGPPATGVATAAMLHLAACTPSLGSANQCFYHQLQDDVLVEPLSIVDGMLAVPQGHGLGVEVDRAKLERFQVT